jgi:predicted membrane GTPase involved in stress response
VVADDAPVVADADGAVDRLLATVKGCVLGVVDAAGERVAAD